MRRRGCGGKTGCRGAFESAHTTTPLSTEDCPMRATTKLRPRLVLAGLAALLAVPTLGYAADLVLRARVYPYQTNAHSIYVGESTNYVTVSGDGDTDLDCWIYDGQGRLVDSDTDNTDQCVLRTPGVGLHRLLVKNYGDVYNNYVVSRR
jgi:hypothetical protein